MAEEANVAAAPGLQSVALKRADQIDFNKISECPQHQNALLYYCMKDPQCVPGQPYFCMECNEEGSSHPHSVKLRDKYCMELNQEFQSVHDKFDKLFNEAQEKYKQYETIIKWISEESKKNEKFQEQEKLQKDFDSLSELMKKITSIRDKINQYALDYKVVEILEEMKQMNEFEKYLLEYDYYRNLSLEEIYKQNKLIFMQKQTEIDLTNYKDNKDFMQLYNQLQNRVLQEENEQLKSEAIKSQENYELLMKKQQVLEKKVQSILNKLKIDPQEEQEI